MICLASGKKQIKQYKIVGDNPHFREHILKAHGITIPTATDNALEQHTIAMQKIRGEELWNNNIRAVSKRKKETSTLNVEPI